MNSPLRMRLRDILQCLPAVQVSGAQLQQLDDCIESVSTDSRTCSPGCLFVALKGEQFDAHDFLLQVVQRGARALLVQSDVALPAVPSNVMVFSVPSSLTGLAQIACAWRNRFDLPLIAVTGSNGKTTVKEMIASILRAAFEERYLSTKGNLNNEIGLPLTLLGLRSEHRAAVIEMGMNHPGEIARLAAVTQATVALVNNAQREHQEFMKSVEAVARENGCAIEMLPASGTAVFPADDAFSSVWRELAGERKAITFGVGSHADVSALAHAQPQDFEMRLQNQSVSVQLQIPGHHNVRNALAAAACASAIGIDASTIVRGLNQFQPAKGRLQSHQLPDGTLLIDDTYNANPDSVLAAISLLRDKPAAILVLGDMGEVGEQGPQFHAEVGRAAAQANLYALFSLGSATRASQQAFQSQIASDNRPAQALHFESADALVDALKASLKAVGAPGQPVTVLVKGSRSMRMERIVQAMNESVLAEGTH
jgi:UDP-N-acetylmuramoyl-tripeptide--D-alanyl-D-alanine ligase